MKREDKIISNKKGNFLRKEAVWKLPIRFSMISAVFLYGRPSSGCSYRGTDDAFKAYLELMKKYALTAKIAVQEACRCGRKRVVPHYRDDDGS